MRLIAFVLYILYVSSIAFASDNKDHQFFRISSDINHQEVRLNKPGRLVFFYNDTDQELFNLEIKFGEKVAFCASGTMRIDSDGTYRSQVPIIPGSFISACFPEPGTYQVSVNGTESGRMTGKVIVNENN